MGRHTSSTPDDSSRRPRPAGLHSLLGWGLFAAVVIGVSGPHLGLSSAGALAASTTTAVAFALLWLVSLRTARRH